VYGLCQIRTGVLTSQSQQAVHCSTAGVYFAFYYFSGTFFFDVIHFLLHQCARSRLRPLRQLSKVHSVHHWHFDRHLQHNDRYRLANALTNLPLELLCQLIGSSLSRGVLCLMVAEDDREFATSVLHITLALEVIRVAVVMSSRAETPTTYLSARCPKTTTGSLLDLHITPYST